MQVELMASFRKLALLLLGIALFSYACLSFAQEPAEPSAYIGDPQFPAPAFPDGLAWLNVPAPLTNEALRGKIVILDFWTYGCINCIHMIPIMEQIKVRYPNEVVVIGVHSAKFSNESALENLEQVIERYDIIHPVVNDEDFRFWEAYGVYAWPTFVVVDPRGNIAAMQAGEIALEPFDRFIGDMVETFRTLGELNSAPLEVTLENAGQPPSLLSFPGKVLADAAGNRLFIADSHNQRIIIADLATYEVRDVIGVGAAGFLNGAYDAARFNTPQGMALVGETLYVADTENHAIRAVDLTARTVSTVAGTGVRSFARDRAGALLMTPLVSPWDIAVGDGVLYVAMAGAHQLWELNIAADHIRPLVGSGNEGLLEGALSDAALAQPSGLVYHAGALYFADAESSSIRMADLNAGATRTLAGPLFDDLFTYGDVDGVAGESRLQHPLGVALGEGAVLYVADTYNSKIKQIDLTTNTITTLAGGGSPGAFRDGIFAEAAFDEPSGLSYANGRLYVADANNHAIRVLDLASGLVTTVAFPNPAALQIDGRVTVVGGGASDGRVVLPEQVVAAGAGEVVLRVVLPDGYKINPLAPSSIDWVNGAALGVPLGAQPIMTPEVRLPVTWVEGAGVATGELRLYYCRAVDESLCYIERVLLDIPLRVTADAGAVVVTVERVIEVPPTAR
jgi:DNA-binding beta-propeller fold protein YncE